MITNSFVKIVVFVLTVLAFSLSQPIASTYAAYLRNTPQDDIPFTKHIIDGNFAGAYDAYPADMDSDGDVDILGTAITENTFAWWENDGNEVFTKHIIDGNYRFAHTVSALDLDKDGDIDIIGSGGAAITWWENDGNQNFTKHMIDDSIGDNSRAIGAYDLDGDNDLDILGTSHTANTVVWYENDGHQYFTKHILDSNYAGASMSLGVDMDKDGDMDVLASGSWAADNIAWWENDGNQNFAKRTVGGSFSGVRYVLNADLNGDGNMDVVGAAFDSSEIAWWRNDGSQIFTKSSIKSGYGGAVFVSAADMDKDGDIDILGTGIYTRLFLWWENDGTGNFTERTIDGDYPNGRSVVATDLDGDGDVDVLGAAAESGTIAWWENKGGGMVLSTNPPATADVGNLVYVPITLTNVSISDDLHGVQISVKVSNTTILTPASNLSPRMGNLFPADSFTYTVALASGWDFMLTATLSPTEIISGAGVIVEFPFYARAEGCVDLNFADHLLTNGNAQLVNHRIATGRICVMDRGNLRGKTYLQGRTTGHFTDTLVVLTSARGVYTTTSDAAGNLNLTNIYSGTYSAYFTHTLFVRAIRSTITVTGQITTTMPEVGLWAGDMNQDGDVDARDWYICAAASIPVDDPVFDINNDQATDIRDCTLLGNNIGRPNMSRTNPPKTSLMTSTQGVNRLTAGYSVGRVVAVSLGSGDILLRAVDVNGQLYATGTRLGLPAGATVTRVELRDGFASGFLRWHQDNDNLYIVAAPHEDDTLTRDTDIVFIHIMGGNDVVIEAASPVGEPKSVYVIFLPIVIRN